MDEKKFMIVHDGTYTKLKVLKQTFAEVSEGQIFLPDNEPFYANELTLINSSQQWVESGISDIKSLTQAICWKSYFLSGQFSIKKFTICPLSVMGWKKEVT